MKWRVYKTGAAMFDNLHALGLGVVIAEAVKDEIVIEDVGLCYQLHTPAKKLPSNTSNLLDRVLCLPRLHELRRLRRDDKQSVRIRNLDGALALLFTSKGVRAVAVHDLLNKATDQPAIFSEALLKAQRNFKRWKSIAQRKQRSNTNWLLAELRAYDYSQPQQPALFVNSNNAKHLSLWLTTDPSFSFSDRNPLSNRLIGEKTSITVGGTGSAVLFAYIGGLRFLRAHRVAGHLVNMYVPLIERIKLEPNTTLPMLKGTSYTTNIAKFLQWLDFFDIEKDFNAKWRGMACQTLQTQGVQQSISLSRELLDYGWWRKIAPATRHILRLLWRRLLFYDGSQIKMEQEWLVMSLTRRSPETWMSHLHDLSKSLNRGDNFKTSYVYNINALQEVCMTLPIRDTLPLNIILKREGGTQQFGRACRLLRQARPSATRDIVDALEHVQSREQLLGVLAKMAQECAVAEAKSPFIIIPNDDDLNLLLEDIDLYGVKPIAVMIIILSVLKYPRSARADSAGTQTKANEGEQNDGTN